MTNLVHSSNCPSLHCKMESVQFQLEPAGEICLFEFCCYSCDGVYRYMRTSRTAGSIAGSLVFFTAFWLSWFG